MEQSIRVLCHPNAAMANDLAGNLHVEALSIQNSNLFCGVFSPDEMLRAFGNFKKSAAPSRFLLFSENDWLDFGHHVFEELKSGFLAGKTTLEVVVDHKTYLFDFLRMARIESDTGRQNSIAWIDVHGRCFFPKNAVDDRWNASEANLELTLRINRNTLLPSPFNHPPELHQESVEVSSDRWPSAKMLSGDDKLYKVVEQSFLSGMKRFIPNTIITSIHRCSHSSIAGISWISSFQLCERSIAEVRGNANVKCGWYGTSGDNIAGIISHGFWQNNSEQLGLAAHGIGIHLSPPHLPYPSVQLSKADEDGERHVILCRVILGNSEKVELGSSQNHPSNEFFDSGVDDLVNPKWFVVWGCNMNSHIIPVYIVSFKSSGSRMPVCVQKKSSLSNLPFCKLFEEVEKSLPASKTQALGTFYSQYKMRKISKEIFIRYIRAIVGDKLLTSTIRRLKSRLAM